jgi:hypothetical protein
MATSNGTASAMTLQKLLIIAVFLAVIYNLGAALYYMMSDKGQTSRTVKSLTWRIGLSVGLILVVCVMIWAGWIRPHGITVGH